MLKTCNASDFEGRRNATLVITAVYLFDAEDMLANLWVKVGEATSVRRHFLEVAEIYLKTTGTERVLHDRQRDQLAIFALDQPT